MGRHWYEKQGKYLMKRNTFSDFISCAEHLIDNGFSTAERLAIEGRSAGGLLMGTVLNMRPDLFKVSPRYPSIPNILDSHSSHVVGGGGRRPVCGCDEHDV